MKFKPSCSSLLDGIIQLIKLQQLFVRPPAHATKHITLHYPFHCKVSPVLIFQLLIPYLISPPTCSRCPSNIQLPTNKEICQKYRPTAGLWGSAIPLPCSPFMSGTSQNTEPTYILSTTPLLVIKTIFITLPTCWVWWGDRFSCYLRCFHIVCRGGGFLCFFYICFAIFNILLYIDSTSPKWIILAYQD